ncbi:huntingtin-interacting protein 1, partial [Diaphorina citri]|uniref:Huntingtin-interacting protein 1 n=1 Tax=Diaphorina citri TaxID=121845 RepID=A0A3Q0IZA4_DIACI
MSSLSLPRVLQPRKTSLELERETFEKFQSASIGKAVNSQETPVKEKHVRIGWLGEPANHVEFPISHFQFHLKDGYGKLIYQYTRLLLGKLDFHRRNPGFPGNLILSQSELDRIGENDINNYFQMSVEMFDYLDEILALQAAVFGSLDMSRSNSMTSSGQCRLSPLIPCIQDSSQLYDFCVKILFKLHASLPSEILAGHRSRFLKQFSQLRQFYMTSSTLQYFKHLIQVPTLPETPPNLLIQAELGSYVTPVVILPDPPSTSDPGDSMSPVTGDLVDISHTSSQNASSNDGSDSPDLLGQRDSSLIEQRDALIEQLQRELSAQRRLVSEQYKIISELRETVNTLELQLATKVRYILLVAKAASIRINSAYLYCSNKCPIVSSLHLFVRDALIEQLQRELSAQRRLVSEQYKIISELRETVNTLELQLATKDSELNQEKQLKDDLLRHTEAAALYHETEKKLKVVEEKFTKLKDVYTKLREEHIALIRQKAGIEKELRGGDKMTKFARAANHLICSIKADVDKQLASVRNIDLEVDHRSKLEEELSTLQSTAEAATEQNEALVAKIDWICKEKSVIESEVQDILAQKNELDVRLKTMEEQIKTDKAIAKSTLLREFTWIQDDICAPLVMETLGCCIKNIENKSKVFSIVEQIKEDIGSYTLPVSLLTSACNTVYIGLEYLGKDTLQQTCFDFFAPIMDNIHEYIMSPEFQIGPTENELQKRKLYLYAEAMLFCPSKIKPETLEQLEKHLGSYQYRKIIPCKAAGKELCTILTSLQVDQPTDLAPFKHLIGEIANMSLAIKSGENPEVIGDLVENELAMMDKAIEEAATRIEEMLTQSRRADTGVKLEVNEKILDSCTTLMKAIRILVQKSRLLQAEIIMAHHGSASNTREFYKRNHQWTEGLISAAKAVAMSAKYLLTAADQVVSGGEGAKLERLIVASHGVAASTAQLVVASRVKAERNSVHLAALSQASRDVTNATGSVVATAKTCIHLVDESADDLDIASLSLHQARRLEMEAQVRVLELEAGLEKERLKLSALRRH